MIWPTMMAFVVLALGLVCLVLCSDAAVESSLRIARRLHVPPILTGLVLVSLGTDLPEIVNSVVSAAAGHASIGLGDAFGSYLAQFTLVLGLLPILARPFPVRRKRILIMGICAVLGLLFSAAMAEKGYFTRVNALVLVASWPAFVVLSHSALGDELAEPPDMAGPDGRRMILHVGVTIVAFGGVAVGSYSVVQAVLQLAARLHVSEYLVSFFVVAIGTSLPELVVDLAAARRGHYDLAIGDAIGSCLVDATAAVGMGQFFFPQAVSGRLALATGSYAGLAAVVVVTVLAVRQKLDKRTGLIFVLLYLAAYLFLEL